jgi:uncharacterized membrane protein YgcG
VAAPASALIAQEAPPSEPDNCGTFQGVVCQGWFTDDAGVVDDDQRVAEAVGRLVQESGNEIAVVIVADSGSLGPNQFAAELGNEWGVGSAERNDGIVVLVSLAERRTEVVPGSGVDLSDATASRIAEAGNAYFADGDFDLGIIAIAQRLEEELVAGGVDDGGDGGVVIVDDGDDGLDINPLWGVGAGVVGLGTLGGIVWAAAAKGRRDRTRRRRAELIDGDLELLEPAGHELPQVDEYRVPPDVAAGSITTAEALAGLSALTRGVTPPPGTAAPLVAADHAIVLDRDRLLADTEIPLELRASNERPILEEAVQAAATAALEVSASDTQLFEVRRQDVQRVVASLRPHRVASARRRAAEAIVADLVATEVGYATLTDAGQRMLSAGPALSPEAPFTTSIAELGTAYENAKRKTETLEQFYEKLPSSTARPAVAAALADLDDDADAAFERYEKLRRRLEEQGDALKADGLAIPALAALLLMNNDDDVVGEFIDVYRQHRNRGWEPGEAVEYALAGLRKPAEIERVRDASRRLGLPVSITAALLDRRDDGPEVYQHLLNELASHDVTGETRQTIAGILAISLEPAQAVRRWLDARAALASLGLEGSYADVAAAFGASDPRGPQSFAVAYAAQRQALARSSIDDADRFAPELAHQGTRRQTDTWTGRPIPPILGTFDPFTLLFYHWVITKGHRGSYGWEPIYRDASWSQDRNSWWGGFGGWGGGGGFSGGGGSSWGGGSFGGFGGFGGGGGFSGGGGSGW